MMADAPPNNAVLREERLAHAFGTIGAAGRDQAKKSLQRA